MFKFLLVLSLFLAVTCQAGVETPTPLRTCAVACPERPTPYNQPDTFIEPVTSNSLLVHADDAQRAVLLRRIIADYPHIVWNGSRRMALRERQGTGQSAPSMAFLPRNEDAWLTRNAQQGLKWDVQRAYAIMPNGVTVWDRKTGKVLWNQREAWPGNAGPSVALGEGRVVMNDLQGVIHCLEGATGQELWRLAYDPANPAPKSLSAYAGNGQTGYQPIAMVADRVYLTTTGRAADNYRIVEVDAVTGRILRQAHPQESDDLKFYPTSFGFLPNRLGFYVEQQEISTGREFETLLVLNQDLKMTWKRRIHGFVHVGDRFVCDIGKQQEGVFDPDNRGACTILVGLDTVGREQWRRALEADVWSVGTWKGSVLALHSTIARNSRRAGDAGLHLSGIRAGDGKVLWTIGLPSSASPQTEREARRSKQPKRRGVKDR